MSEALHARRLQSRIDGCLAREAMGEARVLVHELWNSERTAITAGYVLSRRDLFTASIDLARVHVAVLRSFTVEPVIPMLRAAGLINGLDISVSIGRFNMYAQEILDRASQVYSEQPAIIMLAIHTRDAAPELWEGFPDLDAGSARAVVDRVVSFFRLAINALRENSDAYLVLHTFEVPPQPSQGLLDERTGCSQVAAIRQINDSLRAIASENRGVYILDYDALVARHGRLRWGDERKWLNMRLPFASHSAWRLAEEWLRFIQPLSGRVCKVLVTDLDNTLWGGVLSEEGFHGIRIGTEYPGALYGSLQRVMLDLYRRGILLAVSSKNDCAEAMVVLQNHPGMRLRPEHFASLRINWDDKSKSLAGIAEELNVGLDSLAFLDDNPAERQRIRMELPQVTVVDLPEDPAGYAAALRSSPVFERLSLTIEDRQRPQYYANQRARAEQSAGALEDFYRTLDQKVELVPAGAANLTRLAQLTQKVNQFNLTTRRYSEQQLSALAANPDYSVYGVRVEDRFGDSGIVGVVVSRREGAHTSELDVFLLSCRVIGRTIETAILSHLAEDSLAKGIAEIRGWFLPTKKNGPATRFYSDHRFVRLQTGENGTLWSLDLTAGPVSCPPWIQLIRREECLAQY